MEEVTLLERVGATTWNVVYKSDGCEESGVDEKLFVKIKKGARGKAKGQGQGQGQGDGSAMEGVSYTDQTPGAEALEAMVTRIAAAGIGIGGEGEGEGEGASEGEGDASALGVACLAPPDRGGGEGAGVGGASGGGGGVRSSEARRFPLLTLNAIEANLATGDPSLGR